MLNNINDIEQYVNSKKWPNERFCPRCGYNRTCKKKGSDRFVCLGCKKEFTNRTKSWMNNRRLSHEQILLAIEYIVDKKFKVNNADLAKHIGIGQSTASILYNIIFDKWIEYSAPTFDKLSSAVFEQKKPPI